MQLDQTRSSIGKEVKTCGVWSTSIEKSVAEGFSWQARNKNRPIFMIDHIKIHKFENVPLGRFLKENETVFPDEREWLLPHGLSLKVLQVDQG